MLSGLGDGHGASLGSFQSLFGEADADADAAPNSRHVPRARPQRTPCPIGALQTLPVHARNCSPACARPTPRVRHICAAIARIVHPCPPCRRAALPHLRRDWACPSQICAGTALTLCHSCAHPLPHLRRDWAHPVPRLRWGRPNMHSPLPLLWCSCGPCGPRALGRSASSHQRKARPPPCKGVLYCTAWYRTVLVR